MKYFVSKYLLALVCYFKLGDLSGEEWQGNYMEQPDFWFDTNKELEDEHYTPPYNEFDYGGLFDTLDSFGTFDLDYGNYLNQNFDYPPLNIENVKDIERAKVESEYPQPQIQNIPPPIYAEHSFADNQHNHQIVDKQHFYQHLYQQKLQLQQQQQYYQYYYMSHNPRNFSNPMNTIEHQQQGTKRSRQSNDPSLDTANPSSLKKRRTDSVDYSESSLVPVTVNLTKVEMTHLRGSKYKSPFFDNIRLSLKADDFGIDSISEDATTRNFYLAKPVLKRNLDESYLGTHTHYTPACKMTITPKGMIFGDILTISNEKTPNFTDWTHKKLEKDSENGGLVPWIRDDGLFLYITMNFCISVYNAGNSPMTALIIPIGSNAKLLLSLKSITPYPLNGEKLVNFQSKIGDILLILPTILLEQFQNLSFNANASIEEIQRELIEVFLAARLKPFFVLSEINKHLK